MPHRSSPIADPASPPDLRPRRRSSRARRSAGAAAIAVAASLVAACSPGPGKFVPGECGRSRIARIDLVALTDDGRLACVEGGRAEATRVIGTITGLGSETLVGIDVRSPFTASGSSNGVPIEGRLYGLGSSGGIYTIDTATAAATKRAQLDVALDGTAFGIEVNPTVDRLRIISNTGQNLRVNMDTGVAVVDGSLNAAGAPVTGVAAAGYTNVDSDPATGTTLYVVDPGADQLAIQTPPNAGTVVALGALGTDVSGPIGFDLASTVRPAGDVLTTTQVTGYVSAATPSGRQLFKVSPFTGRLEAAGTFSLPVRDIAAPLAQ